MATLRNPRYGQNGQAPNAFAAGLRNPRATRDMQDGGDGEFRNPPADPVTLHGVPYRTRLRVFEERSGRLVCETWSADDGTWCVPYLNRQQQYLLVCYDADYPALADDHQTPDPMS